MKYLIENDPEFLSQLGAPKEMPELAATLRSAEVEMGTTGSGALGFHADGVPYLKKDSLEIFSWNAPGTPSAQRIPITAVPINVGASVGATVGTP